MSDRPPKVYKYVNAARAGDILGKLAIRFSQVSSLNDATEFSPPTRGVGDQETILNALRQRLEERFPGQIALYRNLYGDDAAEGMLQELLEKGAAEVEANFAKTRDRIYQQLDQNFGVLSLSESPIESLMWTHYGDGERGYLIEFDAAHPWFLQAKGPNDGFRHLRQVNYAKSRDPRYIFELSDDDVMYTKEEQYAWEREWRLILNFNQAKANVGKDSYGIDVLLFAIPPECITGVIIGPRSNPGTTAELQKLITENPDLAHVVFKKAVRGGDGLKVVPVDH